MLLSHAAMLTINLLPALPLDGGRMVFSLGYYVFGVSGLIAAADGDGHGSRCVFYRIGHLWRCAFGHAERVRVHRRRVSFDLCRHEPPHAAGGKPVCRHPGTAGTAAAYRKDAPVHGTANGSPDHAGGAIERSDASLFCVEDAQGKRQFFTDSQVLAALLARPQTTAKDLAAGFACGDGDKDDALR